MGFLGGQEFFFFFALKSVFGRGMKLLTPVENLRKKRVRVYRTILVACVWNLPKNEEK